MKLMVIDGNSIANRAFYGTPALTNSQGVHTGAVYSFFNSLNKLQRDIKPDAISITFDEKGPTFRHEFFDEYKGQRKKMPEELSSQMVLIKEILTVMNIPCYSLSGWEADDLIGTISRINDGLNWETVVVTGDKDSLQLATNLTTIHLITSSSSGTGVKQYNYDVFEEEYGFPPLNLVDLKGIMGDTSDNIPGIKGVGPKTAQPLIQKFHTIDAIYEKLAEPNETLGLTPRLQNLFREGEEICRMSQDLARIRCNAPIEFHPNDSLPKEFDKVALLSRLKELELSKLVDLYALGEVEEEMNAQKMPSPETRELVSLEEVLTLLEKWGEKSVSLLTLPDLKGFALYEQEENICSIILEQHCPFYQEAMVEFFSSSVKFTVFNSKILFHQLLQEGISPKNISFDVELAAYLLSPESKSYDLEDLANKYFHFTLPSADLFNKESTFSPLSDISNAISIFATHCATLSGIQEILQEKLSQNDMDSLYYDLELPLCQVLAKVEHQGISVDRKALILYGDKISLRLEEIEKEIYREAGEEFNINSPKQLGEILFEKMELPPVKKTKTGYSTNVEVLEKLQADHPDCLIISLIMEQRHLSKLHSTYVKGLLKVLTPEGKIHTSFQNTVTATGRLSSTEPNLQNIPIRTPLGAELRNMFVAEEGNVLIDADYSQIELRLLAHIAQDDAMLEAFRSGEDIHSQTASQVFHVPLEDVTSEMRRSAKAVNFGIVYGMSAFALSQDIDVTVAEAKNYIKRYFETYPNVKEYLDRVITQGREDGYVTTLLGRKRWLPELKSANFQRRSFAERMAQNTPIQGAAADIIKKAMVAVSNRLILEGLSGTLVLQVHDELILQCPESESQQVAKLVQEEMEQVLDLSVPLLAETHIGTNWGEAH